MTYKVRLSPHALKEYKRCDVATQGRIRMGLEALQQSPLAGSKVKRLKGRLREYVRYRVGDYRIVYVVDRREAIVYVDYIQHRKDIYRHR